MKFGVMIGPTNRKKRLTFAGDPVPDTDSGSLFHVPHHHEIGDREGFRPISISHTVTGGFSPRSAK